MEVLGTSLIPRKYLLCSQEIIMSRTEISYVIAPTQDYGRTNIAFLGGRQQSFLKYILVIFWPPSFLLQIILSFNWMSGNHHSSTSAGSWYPGNNLTETSSIISLGKFSQHTLAKATCAFQKQNLDKIRMPLTSEPTEY